MLRLLKLLLLRLRFLQLPADLGLDVERLFVPAFDESPGVKIATDYLAFCCVRISAPPYSSIYIIPIGGIGVWDGNVDPWDY